MEEVAIMLEKEKEGVKGGIGLDERSRVSVGLFSRSPIDHDSLAIYTDNIIFSILIGPLSDRLPRLPLPSVDPLTSHTCFHHTTLSKPDLCSVLRKTLFQKAWNGNMVLRMDGMGSG